MENLNLAPARLRYSLAKVCPCGKSNKDGKFSPDKEDPDCGHCHSCDKTFFPKTEKQFIIPRQSEPKKVDFMSSEIMEKSLAGYKGNNFILFCKTLFPDKDISTLAKTYGIGTSKQYNGNSTVFWQKDLQSNVRGGKIIKYDPITGKRNKEVVPPATWVHTVMKQTEFNLSQCLFGLHLIKRNTKPVAIVESEKTAFLMSLEDDSYNWLATAGKGNFKYEILEAVKDRKIFAFPDKGEFKMWSDISERLKDYGFDIYVSDMIENGNYSTGTDLADLLIIEKQTEPIKANIPEPIKDQPKQPIPVQPYTEFEKIKIGMHFPTNELLKLAECIIPENDSITEKEFTTALNKLENLDLDDATDLINVMRLKNVIDLTTQNRYFLFNSTPY